MPSREELEFQHDQTVRQEIEAFRQRAQVFLAGEITEDQFRPFRLKHGIYGQRQPGVQMVRVQDSQRAGSPRAQFEQLGPHRRRIRRRPRPPHHPPEHAVSLRAAGARGRPHAPAGRRRPDQSRSLLQHRPQRHRLPLGRALRPTKFSTFAPTPSAWPTRSCARTSPAICRASSKSPSTAAPATIASRPPSTISACERPSATAGAASA